jgi:hypothetical protein
MLTARLYFTFAVAAISVSCQRLSPAEEKVVGTWEFSGIDFTNRVIYHRNHKSEVLFPREEGLLAKLSPWVAASRGTWRLEGDTIVTDEQLLVGPEPRERRVTRIKIFEFRPNELVREPYRDPFHRVR